MQTTISGVSTPFGRGGIAVIRVSGKDSISVCSKMFKPKNGKLLSDISANSAVYGNIVDNGEILDDGIATVFHAPRSYTGEDMVEISCHGGILITERVFEATLSCGAVAACAGEFTQRAFMNGKMDLSEAEAVIGIIDAESEEKLKLSRSHANGILKRRIDELYDSISDLISSVYVCIDYPEEDLEEIGRDEMLDRLSLLETELKKTEDTYRDGKAISEGIKTVISGKPNSGKSSLLNRLLGEERAIVTDIAGTTRDTIEEKLIIGRVMLLLCDTAGIRDGEGEIEKLGIERSLKKISESELILAVFDGSKPLDPEDKQVMREIKNINENNRRIVCVINKADKPQELDEDEIRTYLGNVNCVKVSALCGDGIQDLKDMLNNLLISGDIDYSKTAVIANARQHSSIKNAREHVERAKTALESGLQVDLCGLDLELALSELGQIDGRVVSEEITNKIFHNFCVGK